MPSGSRYIYENHGLQLILGNECVAASHLKLLDEEVHVFGMSFCVAFSLRGLPLLVCCFDISLFLPFPGVPFERLFSSMRRRTQVKPNNFYCAPPLSQCAAEKSGHTDAESPVQRVLCAGPPTDRSGTKGRKDAKRLPRNCSGLLRSICCLMIEWSILSVVYASTPNPRALTNTAQPGTASCRVFIACHGGWVPRGQSTVGVP